MTALVNQIKTVALSAKQLEEDEVIRIPFATFHTILIIMQHMF